MPSGEERLKEISRDEEDVFVTDSRHLYLGCAKSGKFAPKIEDALIIIAKNTVAKKYVDTVRDALNDHKAVLLVAKGNELKKLVSVVEQVKQKSGKLSQFNKLTKQPSLINPSYSPQHSINNVKVFFGDEIETLAPEESALREIKGHKVYDVPCLNILLVSGVELSQSDFADWTSQ